MHIIKFVAHALHACTHGVVISFKILPELDMGMNSCVIEDVEGDI